MLITYRGRDKISDNFGDFKETYQIPNSDFSEIETFDYSFKASTLSTSKGSMTSYSRIPNGFDSFSSIPNGRDRTSEFLNALKSMQMQAQNRAVRFNFSCYTY